MNLTASRKDAKHRNETIAKKSRNFRDKIHHQKPDIIKIVNINFNMIMERDDYFDEPRRLSGDQIMSIRMQ